MSYKTGFYKGRLGIGLSNTMGMGNGNPRYPLDINGDIRLTGAIVNSEGLALNMVNPDSAWVVASEEISYSAGNVGIGTTSPYCLLQVGNLGAGGNVYSETKHNRIAFPSHSHSNNRYLFANRDPDINTACLDLHYVHNTASLNKHLMTFISDGNVGIGTTSPSELIHSYKSSGYNRLFIQSGSTSKFKLGTHSDGQSFIWNDHAGYIHFGTSGIERMRIKADGKVGIGWPGAWTDTASLSVNGEVRGHYNYNTKSYFGRCYVGWTGDGNYAGFGHLNAAIGTTGYAIRQAYNGDVDVNARSGYPLTFRIGNAEKMRVHTDGNVGIGTTSPEEKLQVEGTSTTRVFIKSSGTGNSGLELESNGQKSWIQQKSDGNIDFMVNNASSQNWCFHSGNVGIGTNSPDNLLHLKGSYPLKIESGTNSSYYTIVDYNQISSYGDKLHINHANSNNVILACGGGKVGIGTHSPTTSLHIKAATSILTIETTAGDVNARYAYIAFRDSGGEFAWIGDGGGSDKTFYIYANDAQPIALMNGNVGIGTASPACGLDVGGESPDPGLGGSMKFGRFMGAGYKDSFPSSGTYASISTDNHGSFTIGNNCHMDTNNCIKYNNTHTTMCGPAICMPGNAQSHQGSIIFYTADPQSVTAGNTFKQIGNTPTLHLDHNGYVGISEAAPAARLHIYSSGTNAMKLVVPYNNKYFQTNWYYGGHHLDVYYYGSTKGFGSTGNGASMYFNYYSAGGVYLTGSTAVTSDDRLKHNEQNIDNALNIINQLKPQKYFKSQKAYDEDYHYQLDASGNPITEDEYIIETGFIAQDVEKIPILNYLVTKIPDKNKTIKQEKKDSNGNYILDAYGNKITEEVEVLALKNRLALKYTDIFVMNVAATQELDRRIITIEDNNNLQINNTENIIGNIPFVNGYTIVNDKKLYNNNISDKLYFNPETGKLNCPNIESTYYGDGSNLQGIATESQINDLIEENKKLKQDNENNKELINFWTQQAMNLNNKLTTMENELKIIKENLGL